MGTVVQVNTYAYATTHVASNLVRSLKQLIMACGLDAAKILGEWQTVESGVATWLGTRHLERLVLEIYSASTGNLIRRFDFDIDYSYHPAGDGDLWIDPDTVDYAIRKSGQLPANCCYEIFAQTSPGQPYVAGWTTGTLRSTSGLTRLSVGAAIGGGELGASLGVWR
ncbi:MAG: HORMA domain containing protein [Acidimicrobiia bacterium]|nr:HORMA domain containing protein [Acidimicrobiia bacterium]MYB74589.1 HORMA domain containing protein [Acidimicrobiia bacterium]MYH99647.1 HORMA domain containing protein [Acidimicrobiia bacterium]